MNRLAARGLESDLPIEGNGASFVADFFVQALRARFRLYAQLRIQHVAA